MKQGRRKNRELNTLSAYLDQELNASERKKLETRLKRDPGLREQLKQLRRTKVLLSQLPRLPAPRKFTLTPEMVGSPARKRQPLFIALQLASSLAAVLLVVLVGIELILVNDLPFSRMAAEAPMMEAAMADEPDLEAFTLIVEPEASEDSDESMLEMEISAVEVETEMQPEEKPVSVEAEKKHLAEESAILGLDPDRAGEIILHSEADLLVEEPPQPPWQDTIRYLQLGLAAIAVSGGLTLWFLKRRNRS